jgi:hypothetical protein
MTWLSAALPYVGGGVLGASVTYGLTWMRERRRTLDAYRAPQRQAIADIVAATHTYRLCELEQRTLLTDLTREETQFANAEMAEAAKRASAQALPDTERALQVGSLTIVDAPCWEAMTDAYVAFDALRRALVSQAAVPPIQTTDDVEQYLERMRVLGDQFSKNVLAMVVVAGRVSPAETIGNRRRRQDARRRLAQRYPQSPPAVEESAPLVP